MRRRISNLLVYPALFFIVGILAVVAFMHFAPEGSAWAWNKVNSQFMTSLISSFAGALGGAGLIYWLDIRNKQRTFLTSINTAIALLSGHMNTVVNVKTQHIIKITREKENLVSFISLIVQIRQLNQDKTIEAPMAQIRYLMQNLHHPRPEFLVALEHLAPFAEKFPRAIVAIMKAKEAFESFLMMVQSWNDLVKEMRESDIEDGVRIPYYLGLLNIGGKVDTRLTDYSDGMLKEADSALFFLRNAIKEITEQSVQILPQRLVSKVAKYQLDDEYQQYMPPSDYVKGWNDGADKDKKS